MKILILICKALNHTDGRNTDQRKAKRCLRGVAVNLLSFYDQANGVFHSLREDGFRKSKCRKFLKNTFSLAKLSLFMNEEHIFKFKLLNARKL